MNMQSCHVFDTQVPTGTYNVVNIISWSKSNRTFTVDMVSGAVHKVKQMMSICFIIYSM